MTSRLRTLALILGALFAVVGLAACGDSHTRVTTGTYAGESGANAPYLNVGPLVYEVQLSRELNPANSEDSAYLQGLGAQERKLEPGQEWFAVFLQVYNHHTQPIRSAEEITISDTQENVYRPIVPNETNPFAYRGGEEVPGNGQLPMPDTIADAGPTSGELLLFKIEVVSLDNRPLEITIVDPENASETAKAELDV